MHHSGRFLNLGSRCYLSGGVSYFDYCTEDEMSMIEINEMAKQINLKNVIGFYYSKRGINDCNDLVLMQHDSDAMNLVNFVDQTRVIAVYVEHKDLDAISSQYVETSIEGSMDNLPNIDEPLGYVGDIDDISEHSNEELGYPTDMNPTQDFDMHAILKDPLDVVDSLMDTNDSGGSDGQSVGDDSHHSDFLVDSEFESDDDRLFDDNVDSDVEWGGLSKSSEQNKEQDRRRCTRKFQSELPPEKNNSKDQFIHNGYPVFNPKLDMDDPKFQVGLCFPNTDSFRLAVIQHSILHGRDIKFPKNDKDRVQVKCKHKSCPWKIFASQIQGEATLQIKTLHAVHECTRKEKVTSANSRWLAKKYEDKIRTDPNWPVDSMMIVMQKDCKLLFSKKQMYRAKYKVKEMSTGSSAEQYGLLWRYAAEIVKTNPGTTIRIKTKPVDDELRFKRIYICWASLKHGFLDGCRPIIFLDGCHLKTSYGGILLSAVGIDANNGIYPFAYAVVEKEKEESWLWFIELFKKDLNIINCGKWTIMSDKQKGLINAVELLMPNCEHRFCVMHLYYNFKIAHKGLALKDILWKAARASRIVDFERVMR
ncbi:hypothetical protein ACJIZ3_011296 [Penstemon smallii]|uniref:Transposase n=1 Tax=Penstemon smallii TaxID=265156 RepID=A0ABD3UIR8_9LAMI